MKNIHVLPTDKPSRLYSYKNNLFLTTESHLHSLSMEYQNIYITNDEKIKEGEYGFIGNVVGKIYNKKFYKKIILTDNKDLIKDGVQAIDDDFLEWFVKNPSCEEVDITTYHVKGDISGKLHYKIIIPKEEITFEEVFGEEKKKGLKEFIDKHKKQSLIDMMQDDEKLGLYEEPKQRLEKYSERFDNKENEIVQGIFNPENWGNRFVNCEPKQDCCTPIGQIKRYVDCKGCDRKPKQETLEEVIPMTELVVFLDKIKKNLTNKTEVLTIQLIIDTIKSEFVDKEIKWQKEQCKKDLDAHLDVAEDLWLQVVKQNKKLYSEEDMLNFADFYNGYRELIKMEKWEIIEMSKKDVFNKWFEQFKKK